MGHEHFPRRVPSVSTQGQGFYDRNSALLQAHTGITPGLHQFSEADLYNLGKVHVYESVKVLDQGVQTSMVNGVRGRCA